MNKDYTVVVLGASPKKDRYGNRALVELMRRGYTCIPVNPAYEEIEGLPAVKNLSEVGKKVHTVTVYVNENRSSQMTEEFLELKPERVIFNPGAENERLETILREHGIRILEACTLVLLGTGRFDQI